MTTWGWVMMGVSWGVILVLAGFCVWRSATARTDELSAPFDIEAQIDREADGKA